MTITIEAGLLARAMKNAAGIVQSAQTIPILAHVRLIASGGTLEITTSDLDTEYRQTLPLAAPGELSVTVEAKRLRDCAGTAAPGAQMTLALDDRRLTVKAGRARWVLPTMLAEDFPVLPAGDYAAPIDLPGKVLADALRRVAWAASTEVSRPWYCGVYLHHADTAALRLFASDGNVGIGTALDQAWPKGAAEITLPNRFVATLAAIAADAENVTLAWDDRKLRAEIGSIVLTGKVIEGAYPNYRSYLDPIVAARDTLPRVAVDPAALRAALRRVELAAEEKTSIVRLIPGEASVELAVREDGSGRFATEEIVADVADGHETGFNRRYLGQMLDAIGGETIEIHQEAANKPAIFARLPGDGALGVLGGVKI